jgi:hypothetical protein
MFASSSNEITLNPPHGGPTTEKPIDPWFLIYDFKDPDGNLAGEAEFFDSAGKKFSIIGASGAGFPASGATKSTHFKEKPPEDGLVVLYLATKQSVVRVPFLFENVPVQPRK